MARRRVLNSYSYACPFLPLIWRSPYAYTRMLPLYPNILNVYPWICYRSRLKIPMCILFYYNLSRRYATKRRGYSCCGYIPPSHPGRLRGRYMRNIEECLNWGAVRLFEAGRARRRCCRPYLSDDVLCWLGWTFPTSEFKLKFLPKISFCIFCSFPFSTGLPMVVGNA